MTTCVTAESDAVGIIGAVSRQGQECAFPFQEGEDEQLSMEVMSGSVVRICQVC